MIFCSLEWESKNHPGCSFGWGNRQLMLTAQLTNNNFSPKDMPQLLSLKKKLWSCCLYYLHFTEEDKVSCSRSHTMVCHRDGFHIQGLSTQGSIREDIYPWDEIFTGVLWPNIIEEVLFVWNLQVTLWLIWKVRVPN